MIFFLLEHSIHFWSQDMDKHHRHPVVNRPVTCFNATEHKKLVQLIGQVDWNGVVKKLIDCTTILRHS